MQVCIVCLETDTKLLLMKDYNLYLIYDQIMGLNVTQDYPLPDHICWECAQKLINSWKFRSKALRSHALMMDILHTHSFITKETVQLIDRKTNNLISTLSCKIFDVNHNDLHLHDTSVCLEDSEQIKSEWSEEEKVNTIELKIENLKDESFDGDLLDDVANDSDSSNKALVTYKVEVKNNKKKTKKKYKKTDVKRSKEKVAKRGPGKPVKDVINEDIFTIKNLSFEEQMAEILKRIESTNYKRSEFKCSKCYKGFLDEDTFNGHMIRHSDQSGMFECEICKVRFKTKHPLQNHMMAHLQKFSCRQCSYVTTRRNAAKLHEKYHNGTRYKCPHCPENFGKISTYMSHVRIKHPSDIVCGLCGNSFVSDKGLALHMKLKHRFDDPVPSDGPYCDLCEVRFTSVDALKVHRKLSARHADDDNISKYRTDRVKHRTDFVCEHCGYSFFSGRGLGMHKKSKHRFDGPVPSDGPYCELCDVRFTSMDAFQVHRQLSAKHADDDGEQSDSTRKKRRNTEDNSIEKEDSSQKKIIKNNAKPEAPISCEQCNMELPDSISYYRHFRRSHPDKNRTNYPSMKTKCMCEVCGKMFQSRALLQDHSFTHTDLKQFKCSQCGKCFQRKYRLIAHHRLHLRARETHGCSVCGKKFTTASNMQRHMVSHTGLKPFKCEMCGKCFKHSSEKRVHITYVHLKKPWPKRSRGKRSESRQTQPAASAQSELDIVQPLWPTC